MSRGFSSPPVFFLEGADQSLNGKAALVERDEIRYVFDVRKNLLARSP
ncbi:MAG: hypothetical protein HY914_21580 [Desulfomonile tiedjei]|nr:hypothetical protein [Desulfomonile tiedjei]